MQLRTSIISHFICFSAAVVGIESFLIQPSATRAVCPIILQSSIGNDDEDSAARKSQELRMEIASMAGAKAIAKLDVHERTKRAMLAEAVEDRIFELVDELELIVAKNNGELSGDAREEAVELAKQTKALQLQYGDLVNGKPSSLLDLGDGD